MDDKLIQALIVSEQLKESRLDEAGKGAAVWQMAKNAGKALLNKVPGAQTVKKVVNSAQNAYKTAANQVDDKKNTETVKQCVDFLAKELCKQMFAANPDENAMKNLMPVLTKNYNIPQDVVNAAYKEVQSNAETKPSTENDANVGEGGEKNGN